MKPSPKKQKRTPVISKNLAQILIQIFPVRTSLSSSGFGECFVFRDTPKYRAALELVALGIADIRYKNEKEYPDLFVVTAAKKKF